MTIPELTQRYFDGMATHDAAGLAELFADDAILRSNGIICQGPGEIEEFYESIFAAGVGVPEPGEAIVTDDRLAVEETLPFGDEHIHLADFFTFENGHIKSLTIYRVFPPEDD